jgi:hypothetical protein
MATKQEMREAIFGKLKSLFSKGKKPPKDVEAKIMADPKLKKLYAKLEKDGEQLKKDNDKVLKMLGIER